MSAMATRSSKKRKSRSNQATGSEPQETTHHKRGKRAPLASPQGCSQGGPTIDDSAEEDAAPFELDPGEYIWDADQGEYIWRPSFSDAESEAARVQDQSPPQVSGPRLTEAATPKQAAVVQEATHAVEQDAEREACAVVVSCSATSSPASDAPLSIAVIRQEDAAFGLKGSVNGAGDTDPRWTGECECGAVTFSLSGAPLAVARCHCSICRALYGGVFTGFARFAATEVHFSSRDALRFTSSSDIARRAACRVCAAPLFVQYHDSDNLWLLTRCLNLSTCALDHYDIFRAESDPVAGTR